MNKVSVSGFRLQNLLHTVLLLAGMLLLLSLIGWLVAAFTGVLWALFMGVVLIFAAPRLSPRFILFLHRARPLSYDEAAQLNEIIYWLTERCHLARAPRLYFIPSPSMFAFSVGLQKDVSIAISAGLLRELNVREMTAVLAHEISHIQSKDLLVMAIADAITRITGIMALAGYLMILFYLPFLIFQNENMPWLLLILLLIAPNLSALMQLALSRTGEFGADMQAIRLTGDPQGLISALSKIEHYSSYWFNQRLLPGLRVPYPSLLRTHPYMKERIRRLRAMT